jgi:5-methyltetrahydrofolate--homocysteine methyltransferase
MNSFLERLRSDRPILWDGGMGTQLQVRGLAPGDAPERFNLTHPEVVAAVHRDYFAAGAEGVETNTFGANRIGLDRYELGDSTTEINRRGAEIARSVCPAGSLVAGSVGPTGQIPEPYGSCPLSQMYDAFAEQALALKEGGVDLFIVETMVDLGEISQAVEACLRETGLPVAALMTFDPVRQGFRTVMGVSPAQAAEALLDLGACAVGTNCSNSIATMVEIARDFRRSGVTAPLVVMPNAGVPEVVGMKTVYRETPEKMAAHIRALVEAGAGVVGGCCGTTPEHVEKFREALDRLKRADPGPKKA